MFKILQPEELAGARSWERANTSVVKKAMRETMQALEVGEGFTVPVSEHQYVSVRAKVHYLANEMQGKKFSTRRTEEGTQVRRRE